nr:aromatic aldehyde synthase [Euura sp. 'Pontania]
MDAKEFREFGQATIEYMANYIENSRNRDVLPSVEPGYLNDLLPKEAPLKPERWQDVLKDVEEVIMPGVTHWNSPNFYAYYPTGNSYATIVADIVSAGIGCIGFSWMSSPACTELEVVTMNWLGKLIGLPEIFLNSHDGPGGGVIQGSASEATLICLLAAKERTTRRLKKLHPEWDDSTIKSKLVAYTSEQANSSVEKAGLLGSMTMRLLQADEECRLRGSTLLKAMQEDEAAGLVPCYVVANYGTTGTCAFDCLEELGPICKERDVWIHVDAAYAGAALACPEFRHLMPGLDIPDSFSFNPHKWMLVNFDCSALWVQNSRYLIEASNVERIYLAHDNEDKAPDYRHWQIPLGRRFRSLKLWFVMRIFGVEGIQSYIRHCVSLARYFVKLVNSDDRFEIVTETTLGLVCFRIKGENSLTKELIDRLTKRKQIYVITATYGDKLIVRFAVGCQRSEERDLDFAWKEITTQTSEILRSRSMTEIGIFEGQRKIVCNNNIGSVNKKLQSLNIVENLPKKSPTIS